MDWRPYNKDQEVLEVLSLHPNVRAQERPREDKAEDSPSPARKRGFKGTDPADTLIFHSQPPEWQEGKC